MEKQKYQKSDKWPPKPTLQSISIFNYYLKQLFPTLFQDSPFPPHSFAKLRAAQRSLTYNYVHEVSAGIEGVTPNTILEAAKQTYSEMQGVTASDCGFERKTTLKLPYLPVWREMSEKIDFVVINESQKEKEIKVVDKQKQYSPMHTMNDDETNTCKQIFCLYIVHRNIGNSDKDPQWQNFIERYQFRNSIISEENILEITYQSVFVYQNSFQINFSHKFPPLFHQNLFSLAKNQKGLLIVQRLCSKLRSLVQAERATMKVNFQSVSFDQAHRRELRLNQTQRALFNVLKVKAFALFGSLNRNRDANRYFLQNLVCRMMENQNYAESESWESIKYYLEFERKMREKYRWSDFEKFDKMNIFSYIGKDRMGRPILLNRIRNVLCSKIEDFNDFFDYHFYLFEIYLQDKMEGWVDQFIVIADASNQILDNLSLGFTKRILTQSLKVTFGRVYKIIAFDVNFLGTTLYKVLKPFLPDKFTQCIKIFGEDKKQLIEELRKNISDKVISQFLSIQESQVGYQANLKYIVLTFEK